MIMLSGVYFSSNATFWCAYLDIDETAASSEPTVACTHRCPSGTQFSTLHCGGSAYTGVVGLLHARDSCYQHQAVHWSSAI